MEFVQKIPPTRVANVYGKNIALSIPIFALKKCRDTNTIANTGTKYVHKPFFIYALKRISTESF